MHPSRLSATLIAAVVLGATCSAVRADLPAARTMQYKIRDTPTDAESNVVFIVELAITAEDSDGDSIGWKIKEIRFLDKGVSPPRSWIEAFPDPGTQDGLWWIEHGDSCDPQDSEFDVTPLLDSTATAQGQYNDLDYSMQGASYGGSPSYGGNVSALTYEFTIQGDPDPEEEGDDEPAEVDGEHDPT